MKSKVFAVLGILFLFVPLGLLTSSPAWGEWENEYYLKILGYIPKGISTHIGLKPLLPDYSLKGGNEILWYYLSAIIGIALIFTIFFVLAKLNKNRKQNAD